MRKLDGRGCFSPLRLLSLNRECDIYLLDYFLPNMCHKWQECDIDSPETQHLHCFPFSKYHLEFHSVFNTPLDSSGMSLLGASTGTRKDLYFTMIIIFIEFIPPLNLLSKILFKG